ncbi:histidinol phosphate phosphatase H [Athelia psychrophila]|uniref:Histidinol-phosphatase n=1 Tax=Athelia psychrophila TaxID=1759441 RepID=A0A166FEX8_9AGAM|nr:histidinol phosphate phosphatase H [Fibularhizoctonia sp. CBS 109695]
MPHSHHSHSGQFCQHASGLLEEVVVEAVKQGFEMYGLTEHVPRYREEDLYPEEQGAPLDILTQQFTDFLQEAHRLKLKYESKISLIVGLETEFITRPDLDRLQELLSIHGSRIEYIVGSVHHVNGVPIDFDLKTFDKALSSCASAPTAGRALDTSPMEGLLSAYFDAQYEIILRFKPEIIGHFDLCRLYHPGLRFSDYPLVWEKILRNVQLAIGYGALFEVNAAAFRKGWQSAYPAEDVLELIAAQGGHLALSDDSHGPQSVGLNYDRLARYLRHIGVCEIWRLESSAILNAAGRPNAAVKIENEWWNHSFWKERSSAAYV